MREKSWKVIEVHKTISIFNIPNIYKRGIGVTEERLLVEAAKLHLSPLIKMSHRFTPRRATRPIRI